MCGHRFSAVCFFINSNFFHKLFITFITFQQFVYPIILIELFRIPFYKIQKRFTVNLPWYIIGNIMISRYHKNVFFQINAHSFNKAQNKFFSIHKIILDKIMKVTCDDQQLFSQRHFPQCLPD